MQTAFPQALFWKLQVAGWFAYAALLIVPWLGYYSLQSMLPNKLVIAGSGLAVSCGLRAAYKRYHHRGARGLAFPALVLAASVVAGAAWYFAAAAMLGGWPHQSLRILG